MTGLRGIAALLVVLQHSWTAVWGVASQRLERILHPLCCGWIGVDLFFVLSGFLLTKILLENTRSRHYYRNFYARRCLRIWPLYYLTLAVIGVVALLTHQLCNGSHSGTTFLFAAAFLSNLLVVIKDSFDIKVGIIPINHYWSLAVEEHFYAFWPAVARKMNARRLLLFCLITVAIVMAVRILYYVFGGSTFAIYAMTPFRLDSILTGAAVACLLTQSNDIDRLNRRAMLAMCLGFPLLLGLLVQSQESLTAPIMVTFGYTIIAFCFSSLICFLVTTDGRDWLSRALSHRAMLFTGKHSYAIYLFHFPVVVLSSMYLASRARLISDPTVLLMVVIAPFLITLALSFASWHLVEKHFLRMKDRFSD